MSSLQRVDELNILTRAKYPILYIVSWEERRIEDMLRQVAIDRRKKLYGWTLTDGIAPLDLVQANSVDPSTRDPLNALDFVAMSQEAGRVYDVTNTPMKNLCLKKGMQAIQLEPGEKEKIEQLTIPLRNEWIQEMDAKGLPGKAVLDAALTYINGN